MSKWHDAHFVMFSALERDDFSHQEQEEFENILFFYLQTSVSETGLAAWKAGDTLGDEWYSERTIKLLCDALAKGRYAAGRKAAIHGIDEVLKRGVGQHRTGVVEALIRASREDKSALVRQKAEFLLEDLNVDKRRNRADQRARVESRPANV